MELSNMSDEHPAVRLSGQLTGAQREALRASFSQQLQITAPAAGIRTASAIPCREGGAPACETTRRGVRWMPQDRAPAGGYFALPTVGKKHSTLARLLAMVFRNKKA
jgi:hypothetical protein